METVVFGLILIYIFFILYEKKELEKNRKKIKFIIHINGIRGKSTVSRLIDAGLRDGNRKVFTKVTGTSPKYIDIDGIEKDIKRRGKANIREQIKIIKHAAKRNVEILILECMAVKPELQKICEEKIIKANIAVITNVREDHLDEMGATLDEIAKSLGEMVPKNGKLFLGEGHYFDFYKEMGNIRKTKVFVSKRLKQEYEEIDFIENVALAIEVCYSLGVDRDVAFERMKNYKRDLGVLRELEFKNKFGKNISFINALAANDPDSTQKIIEMYNRTSGGERKRYLMINNRRDRISRMQQFVEFTKRYEKNFEKIFISGENKNIFYRELKNQSSKLEIIDGIERFETLKEDSIIFAVGNICGKGKEIVSLIENRGIHNE
ncbi:poly-gamma-glutamate synthase PgsB [Cetobacterium sp. 8H]|uniref:poly-gamma-glutamate synthase PgsB n=1 Tax=Cetobacterium sp. 8H TaxID=2759681 RepID=UPI00163C0840|nr:poly-gamma-glutamate synthase PgsB [Cetobacterium sp. 8H]MBC2851734.1 poly-gamma-glutamate synthase PgsB [Cetobacterium sp. 8H]